MGGRSGTELGKAVKKMNDIRHDRLIVITGLSNVLYIWLRSRAERWQK